MAGCRKSVSRWRGLCRSRRWQSHAGRARASVARRRRAKADRRQRSGDHPQAPYVRPSRPAAHRNISGAVRVRSGLKIFVIGSSITSSYWNGAATYYRGIYGSLAALGHDITFAEPDAYGRQQHRDGDLADFAYLKSWVYQTPHDLPAILNAARQADLVIKHSGVGVDDALLEYE